MIMVCKLYIYYDKGFKQIMLINAPLHIIDHRSVLYLILKILLYNQQYVYNLLENNNGGDNDSVSSVTVTSVVTMKIIFYESYVLVYFVVTESSAIIMMMAPLHESPSVIHDETFSAVADSVTMTTTSYTSLSSHNNNDNDGSNNDYMDVFDAIFSTPTAVMMKVYDITYNIQHYCFYCRQSNVSCCNDEVILSIRSVFQYHV